MPAIADRQNTRRALVERGKGADPSATVDLGAQPERALWMAVIWQAIADARSGVEADEIAARQFLLAQGDSWARSRAQVCEYAGLDEDWLRRQMAAVLGDTPI